MPQRLNRRRFFSVTAGTALLPALATAQQEDTLPNSLASGKTSASGAIQLIVDRLDSRGGGTIEFPAGEFLIDEPIDLAGRRGIRFAGVSSGTGSEAGTRLMVRQPGIDVFRMNQSKGILFENLLLHACIEVGKIGYVRSTQRERFVRICDRM